MWKGGLIPANELVKGVLKVVPVDDTLGAVHDRSISGLCPDLPPALRTSLVQEPTPDFPVELSGKGFVKVSRERVPVAEEAGEHVTAGIVLIRAEFLTGPKISVIDALNRGLEELDKGALNRQHGEALALKCPVLLENLNRIQVPEIKTSPEVLLESALPGSGVAADDQRAAECGPISCGRPTCDVLVGVVVAHDT